MKKIILILLLLISLAACTSKAPSTQTFALSIDGKDIVIGQNAESFLKLAGEPIDRYTSPSCAFEGDDNVYDYGHYQITTFVDSGVEKFTGFYLLDESISTKEGIKIGSSFEEMVDKYGSDYVENFGAYTYNRDLTDLSFVVVDGKITSIAYLHVVDQ